MIVPMISAVLAKAGPEAPLPDAPVVHLAADSLADGLFYTARMPSRLTFATRDAVAMAAYLVRLGVKNPQALIDGARKWGRVDYLQNA